MTTVPSLPLYLAASITFLIGLALLFLGLLAGRARGQRRCPRCWYDLANAILPIRCPECGRDVTSEPELSRTRRRWRSAALGLLLALPLPALVADRHAFDFYYAIMPKWKRVESRRWADITAVRWTIRDPRERGMRAVVTCRSKSVLTLEDIDIQFGERDWSLPANSGGHQFGCGDDLNADGTPELVVFAYSGGAHCCYTISLLELSDPPRIVATFDAQNGMGIMPSTTRPGEYDLDVPDQSFDYWNAPHASSPMPSVFYRLLEHQLVLDLPEMQRPVPDRATLDAEASRVRSLLAASGTTLDPELWRIMLELVYSGNEPAARSFFDAAWPPGLSGKDEFHASFRKVLEASPHYRNLTAARTANLAKPAPAELPGSAALREK